MSKSPPEGRRESEEEASARRTLGLAFCNRSVANFLVGNMHNGKVCLGNGCLSTRSVSTISRAVSYGDQRSIFLEGCLFNFFKKIHTYLGS